MRDIKFRAWEVKEKRMLCNGSFDIHLMASGIHGISYHFLENKTRQYRFNSCKGNNWDPTKPEVILMQFTGLQDKNRNDIYEGDIVKITVHDNDDFGHATIYVVRISWNERRHGFKFEDDKYRVLGEKEWIIHYTNLYSLTETFSSEFEVIGNIHDNPNLLGERKQ